MEALREHVDGGCVSFVGEWFSHLVAEYDADHTSSELQVQQGGKHPLWNIRDL